MNAVADGADSRAADDLGKTPADIAEMSGFKEAATLLKRPPR